jgi:hypothetical protein
VGLDGVAGNGWLALRIPRLCSGSGFDDYGERMIRRAIGLARLAGPPSAREGGARVSSVYDNESEATLVPFFLAVDMGDPEGEVSYTELVGSCVYALPGRVDSVIADALSSSPSPSPSSARGTHPHVNALLEVLCVDPLNRGNGWGKRFLADAEEMFGEWLGAAFASAAKGPGKGRERGDDDRSDGAAEGSGRSGKGSIGRGGWTCPSKEEGARGVASSGTEAPITYTVWANPTPGRERFYHDAGYRAPLGAVGKTRVLGCGTW